MIGILLWIILGGVAGWIANSLMKRSSLGLVGNVVVGIIGGFIGGFLMRLIGASGGTGFNLWSLIVAVLGAMVLLYVVDMVKS